MGRAYDGKKRWNETVLRTNAAATAQRAKKTKRYSGAVMFMPLLCLHPLFVVEEMNANNFTCVCLSLMQAAR